MDLFEERERPTPEFFTTAIGMLIADYENRGIELVEVASGWRIQVRQKAAEVVSRLWSERPAKYSRAFLETLALIAYRQPITRSEIEEIRGVSISSTIMRTLQERGWIRTVGHREVPGRPELLGTTRDFLDYFGLKSLDQAADAGRAEGPRDHRCAARAAGRSAATDRRWLKAKSRRAPKRARRQKKLPRAARVQSPPVTLKPKRARRPMQSADAEAGKRRQLKLTLVGETVAEADADDGDSDDDDSDDGAESNEDGDDASTTNELSADADDGDEDSGTSSPMVASSDEEEADHARISDPPSEGYNYRHRRLPRCPNHVRTSAQTPGPARPRLASRDREVDAGRPRTPEQSAGAAR